jgi:hypothetical protein
MTASNNSFFGKIWELIFHPQVTFHRKDDLIPIQMFYYLCSIILINFIFLSIFTVLDNADINLALSQIFDSWFFLHFLIIVLDIAIFIGLFGLWLHVWIYCFGGRRPILQTLTIVIYGLTPGILVFWIPFIIVKFLSNTYISVLNRNLELFWISIITILIIWACFIIVLGIKEKNGFSWIRTFAIVCCTIATPVIFLFFLGLLNANNIVSSSSPVALTFPRINPFFNF